MISNTSNNSNSLQLQKIRLLYALLTSSILILFFMHSNLVHAQTDLNAGMDDNSAGELMLEKSNGQTSQSLLLDTDIEVDVNGLVATITMRQHFKNDSNEWVNGRYAFPLPENGAVDGMTIQIGDRIIVGTIKEKQAAKKAFIEAKKAGKKAGLLEQHRPNIFSMSVANIPPNSDIIAEIRIIDHVKYDNQEFSLRLPTTLTPRYIPGKSLKLDIKETQDVQINHSSGWGINTDLVPDADAITPPQTHAQDSQTDHRFSLQLNLNAGIELSSIESTSHEISIEHDTKKTATLTLKNTKEKMDKDVTIRWKPIKTQAPTAALFQQTIAEKHYSMAMLLPPTANINNALPRQITFIVDSSGSMSGNSMSQAKKSLLLALDKLSPNDRFNLIDFDSTFSTLFNRAKPASTKNILLAKLMIKTMLANGGTEMFGPLEYALSTPAADNFLKQVIFITDGAVGNEQQLFKLISDNLGDARLFTVGIGSAPNSHFMSKAAQFGRGSFTYVSSTDETTEKMSALFNKINKPIASDLVVHYPNALKNNTTIEQYPIKIPDLYSGEPLIILTESNHAINSIEVSANLLGNPWNRTLNGHSTSADNADNLDALWARKKVAHLMDNISVGTMTEHQAKPEIIKLGIQHHLLTKYTSFIAIEQTPSKPEEVIAKNKNVPNLMPKGNTMKAPQTATPAQLLALLGGLLILLSIAIRQRNMCFQ